LRPATLRHHERRIDEAFRFIQGAFVAKLVGYIHQHSPQNFIAAPGLKAPMNGFVVRIALRQHMPLRAGVEYPQYSFENTSGRDRLASRTSIGDMLFRKMIPDALPLLVCQPNHPTFIADRLRLAISLMLDCCQDASHSPLGGRLCLLWLTPIGYGSGVGYSQL